MSYNNEVALRIAQMKITIAVDQIEVPLPSRCDELVQDARLRPVEGLSEHERHGVDVFLHASPEASELVAAAGHRDFGIASLAPADCYGRAVDRTL